MNEFRSEQIDIISAALSKAQGSYKPLVANQDAPAGKYANLSAILDSVREALSSNGLAFYQYVELLDKGSGASLLKTVLSHESGQWISSTARIVIGRTFRETFNCSEAYRRLNALLILGIAPSDKDPLIKDDDGLEQSNNAVLADLKKPGETVPKSDFSDRISMKEYEDLMNELEGFEEIAKGIQNYYGITTISDLPKDQFYIVQARIRKLKKDHQDWIISRR